MSEITRRARKQRTAMTQAEKLLWNEIRNKQLNIKFRRQYPLIYFNNDTRHCFIADFACLEKNLILEIDGKIHDNQKEYDEMRTHIINHLGFKVIRFKNEEIHSNIEKIIKQIKAELSLPSPVEGEGLGMGESQR